MTALKANVAVVTSAFTGQESMQRWPNGAECVTANAASCGPLGATRLTAVTAPGTARRESVKEWRR